MVREGTFGRTRSLSCAVLANYCLTATRIGGLLLVLSPPSHYPSNRAMHMQDSRVSACYCMSRTCIAHGMA